MEPLYLVLVAAGFVLGVIGTMIYVVAVEGEEYACVMCSDETSQGPCFGGDRCFASGGG